MTPSWPQIRGLTYSTIGRNLVGTMHAGSEPRRVYLGHPGRLRIEDSGGNPTWIDTPTDSWTIPAGDSPATHRVKNPHTLVSYTGLGHHQLLQPHRWWPIENRLSQIDIGEPEGPTPVEVRGRTGHELVFPNGGSPITLVIDAEIGVALRWEQSGEKIELSEPEIDVDLDPSLFRWDGPVVDEDDPTVSDEQRAHEAKMQAIAEMPTTTVGHIPVTVTTSSLDGDPLTGALDVSVFGQSPQIFIRRWLTGLPEPELPFHLGHVEHTWRREIAPWTVELRAHKALLDDETDRIFDSLRLPEPPGAVVTLRQQDEARRQQADAEALRNRLGTGRSLAELLAREYSPSLLIRTDFSDDERWRAVAEAAMAPVDSGDPQFPTFEANLVCVDSPENEGLSPADLVERTGDDPPFYAFLADTQSMTDREKSILVVDLGRTEWGADPGRTFRVIPSEMWSVENNLSISKMDLRSFADAVDDDGVFRGFPPPPKFVRTLDREQLLAISRADPRAAAARLADDLAHDSGASCELHEHSRKQWAKWVRSFGDITRLLGGDELVAATQQPGVVHSGFLQLGSGGNWQLLLNPDTGALEAALLVEAPKNDA